MLVQTVMLDEAERYLAIVGARIEVAKERRDDLAQEVAKSREDWANERWADSIRTRAKALADALERSAFDE